MPIENTAMMEPGYSTTVAVSDLPMERSGIHGMLSDEYGFDEAEAEGLNRFLTDTAKIESEGGVDNPDSSAKGTFQFLTHGDDNSFQTGLNRLSTAYRKLGGEVPEWVAGARDHNDPGLLSERQQRDLALGNLFSSIKDPEETERLFRGASRGDLDASVEMYMKYHHRGSGGDKATKRARARAASIYSGAYGHGGLVRDSYGRGIF